MLEAEIIDQLQSIISGQKSWAIQNQAQANGCVSDFRNDIPGDLNRDKWI